MDFSNSVIQNKKKILKDAPTVNCATYGLRRSPAFFDDTGQVSGHGPGSHGPSSAQDIVHGDVAIVLDVLDFLAVTWRFL